LYEFIYSFRDSYNATYPTPEDQSFTDALKMLRKLKEEVASGIEDILINIITLIY